MRNPAALPVLAALAAIFVGACMDAVIKHLSLAHSAVMIAFCRFAFGSAVAALYWAADGARPITPDMWRVHLARGVFIVIAATTFFFALSRLALVEAMTLAFVAPLFVAPIAWIILRERMRKEAIAAAGLGFLGVAIAVAGEAPAGVSAGPERLWGAVAVLVSALAYAVSLTLLRMRSGKDGAVRTTLMGNLVPAAILLPFAGFFGPWPAAEALPLFALVGFFGASLWTLMAWAYARAEAQTLAPLEYSAIIWSTALGFFLFQEVPAPATLAGGAVIVAACLWATRAAQPAKAA